MRSGLALIVSTPLATTAAADDFALPGGDAERGRGNSVASGELSRMGDFTAAMTMRQLLDLIAFLRAQARR